MEMVIGCLVLSIASGGFRFTSGYVNTAGNEYYGHNMERGRLRFKVIKELCMLCIVQFL